MDAVAREKAKLSGAQRRAYLAMSRATTALQLGLQERLRSLHDLDLQDYDTLMILWEAVPDGVRMSDLSQRIACSRSLLSHRIEKLERAGLVRREQIESDGRGLRAVLTDDGHAKLVAAVKTKRADLQGLLFNSLDEVETAELGRLMSKIALGIPDPTEPPEF